MSNPFKDIFWGPDDLLIICAFRYALKRKSYAPTLLAAFIKEHWAALYPKTQKIIQKEINDHLEEIGEDFKEDWKEILEFKVSYE